MKIQKILVPIDFSSHSEAALALGLEFTEKFNAELHIVHVFPETLALAPPYGPSLPADFGMAIERGAVEHFEKWQAEFCPPDVAISSHVLRGDPSRRIVELAKDLEVDLIIMGTRGNTGLEHVLLGSVAERTVRHSSCAVLTTKAGS